MIKLWAWFRRDTHWYLTIFGLAITAVFTLVINIGIKEHEEAEAKLSRERILQQTCVTSCLAMQQRCMSVQHINGGTYFECSLPMVKYNGPE